MCIRDRIGPGWFRTFTFAFTSGVFVGALVIKDEGVDFHILEPTWLAIGLFVAVPALVGAAVPRMVDEVAARAPTRGSWIAVVMLQVVFFLSAVSSVIVALVMAPGVAVRRVLLAPVQRSHVAMWVFRAAFMLVPVAGVIMLREDIRSLM